VAGLIQARIASRHHWPNMRTLPTEASTLRSEEGIRQKIVSIQGGPRLHGNDILEPLEEAVRRLARDVGAPVPAACAPEDGVAPMSVKATKGGLSRGLPRRTEPRRGTRRIGLQSSSTAR
jgi:hypothetical protein